MDIFILIPTLWNKEKIERLLKSIKKQTIKPKNIILILDKFINTKEKQELLSFLRNFSPINITLVNNIDYDFTPQNWVSCTRNFGLKIIDKISKENDIIIFMDDDISLPDKKTFQKIMNIYSNDKNFLIFPTVINWYSKKIETQWIISINPFTMKLKFIKPKTDKRKINMSSLQMLVWPYKIFKNFRFDERFQFVYEDLDFTYTISKHWIKIIWFSDLKILHWDKKESKAEKSYVSNPFLAYQKWKNRILFVKKHFNIWQKIIFFTVWYWIHTLGLIIIILFFWWNKKWKSIKALLSFYEKDIEKIDKNTSI